MKLETAYQLDELLQRFENRSLTTHDFDNKSILKALKEIQTRITSIEPVKQLNDLCWALWIEMPRGSFDSFAQESIEEEEDEESLEEIYSELRNQWSYGYPEPFKWYQLFFRKSSYSTEFIIAFDGYVVMLKDAGVLSGINHSFKEQKLLLAFIDKKVTEIVEAIVRDAGEYNKMLEKRLAKRNRIGRIHRQSYWDAVPEARRLDKELGTEKIQKLTFILPIIAQERILDQMTADDFFYFCAICYDSNETLCNDKKWTPREKYERHADMRDEGLTKIDGTSEAAFRTWYRSNRHGGHPWEICRGGNSTHISLFVSETNNQKWRLTLAGSSFSRVVETVNMALALYEQGVLFCLADAEEILRMVTGQDYIGLVPSGVRPRYCHDLFPEEDRITDFIDPWMDESLDRFQPLIHWYPLTSYTARGHN
jgi:hypothetical protein